MKIQPGSTLLMIGDSITDCGRLRPGADPNGDPLGSGYVSLINACLQASAPLAHIRVINMGVGGNTVRDLSARWASDVIALKPDWLSIMIGINDVWRQFDSVLQIEAQIGPEEFTRTLEALIQKTLPQLKGLVLMTPYFIEPDQTDPMRMRMDEYGAEVRKIAVRCSAIFVDTQAVFDNLLANIHPTALAEDRVHPNLIGHMLLALAFLKAVDHTW